MKSVRFWILMAGSILVCVSYLLQISLVRSIQEQQRVLTKSQQVASLAPTYESSWKELAARVYEASRQDAALVDVLKRNQISVKVNAPAPAAAPASVPVAPSVPVPAVVNPKHAASTAKPAIPSPPKVPASP